MIVVLASGILGTSGGVLPLPDQSNLYRLLMLGAFVIMSLHLVLHDHPARA
jgi:hypothetical protein